MMKVLMLGWELPPYNSGGLGVACFNLVRALVKQGNKVEFLLPYKGEHQKIEGMEIVSALDLSPLFLYGVSAYNVGVLGKITVLDETGKEKILSLGEIRNKYKKFALEEARRKRPDIVHAHDWLTMEAGVEIKEKLGIPLVVHIHATEYDRSGGKMGDGTIYQVEKMGMEKADKVLVVSEVTRELVRKKYHIGKEKIEVIYNSLDDEFESEQVGDKNKCYFFERLKENGYTIVLTVGRFTAQKGMEYMLRAAALALKKEPKLIFILVGNGEERSRLVRLAAELGIARKVAFTGFLRGEKLKELYKIADIFVMSSVSEPFGLTALEAAKTNNALILTKQVGVGEILKTKYQYDFWDEAALAEGIVKIAQNTKLREELSRKVKEECQKVTWGESAKKCNMVYKEIVRATNKK